jgi:hypothetical protein
VGCLKILVKYVPVVEMESISEGKLVLEAAPELREDSEALLESISSPETDSESSFFPEEVRVQFNGECCSSAGIKFCVRFRNGTGIDLDPVLDKNQNNQHIQE